ncbi:MAG: peptidylprolyl isomerase [Synergistales bacterium]
MKKSLAIVGLLIFLLALTTLQAVAADQVPVMKVGTESVSANDLLYLLTQKAGGNEAMAGMVFSGMSVEDKKGFLTDIADLLLVFQAAQAKGIQLNPAVAAKLRWDAVNTMAQFYVERQAAGWDMSEKAIRSYFEAHRENYAVKEAVHVRHILVESEAEARNLLLSALAGDDFAELAAKSSKDQGSAEKGGDLGWIEKGDTVPVFEQAAFSARKGSFAGPIKSEYGWHVIQVLGKRPAGEGLYEAVKNQVARDLQQSYLEEELARLRKAAPLSIDEKQLAALGQ